MHALVQVIIRGRGREFSEQHSAAVGMFTDGLSPWWKGDDVWVVWSYLGTNLQGAWKELEVIVVPSYMFLPSSANCHDDDGVVRIILF